MRAAISIWKANPLFMWAHAIWLLNSTWVKEPELTKGRETPRKHCFTFFSLPNSVPCFVWLWEFFFLFYGSFESFDEATTPLRLPYLCEHLAHFPCPISPEELAWAHWISWFLSRSIETPPLQRPCCRNLHARNACDLRTPIVDKLRTHKSALNDLKSRNAFSIASILMKPQRAHKAPLWISLPQKQPLLPESQQSTDFVKIFLTLDFHYKKDILKPIKC